MKPRRTAAAAEGIALLKQGSAVIKLSAKEGKPKTTMFKLDEDETVLSWEGSGLGKVLRSKERRNVRLDEVLELQVGSALETSPDLLALERTKNFVDRPRSASLTKSRAATPMEEVSRLCSHLLINLVLLGSLPTPPSLDGAADAASPTRGKPARDEPARASLTVQCPDADVLGLWVAALRTLLAERQPPSPLGPAALLGAFGAPLEEVALADASLGGSLLVPAPLEALWLALGGAGAGLATEGLFRLSAAEAELAELRRRLHEADGGEAALEAASAVCVAAAIKLYLRELPAPLWAPVRAPLAALRAAAAAAAADLAAHGAPPAAAAAAEAEALGRGLRELLPRLGRRAADLVVWGCELMAAVVAREADNRMGAAAVAAVFAPVLMRGAAADEPDAADAGAPPPEPMAAMQAAMLGVRLAEELLAEHRRAPLTRKRQG